MDRLTADPDTMREILANKLCAVLGRSELRDLVDLRALLGAGLSLEPALVDAGRKDGGFSAVQLAWALRAFPLDKVASAEGMGTRETAALAAFRDDLVSALLRLNAPAR